MTIRSPIVAYFVLEFDAILHHTDLKRRHPCCVFVAICRNMPHDERADEISPIMIVHVDSIANDVRNDV